MRSRLPAKVPEPGLEVTRVIITKPEEMRNAENKIRNAKTKFEVRNEEGFEFSIPLFLHFESCFCISNFVFRISHSVLE